MKPRTGGFRIGRRRPIPRVRAHERPYAFRATRKVTAELRRRHVQWYQEQWQVLLQASGSERSRKSSSQQASTSRATEGQGGGNRLQLLVALGELVTWQCRAVCSRSPGNLGHSHAMHGYSAGLARLLEWNVIGYGWATSFDYKHNKHEWHLTPNLKAWAQSSAPADPRPLMSSTNGADRPHNRLTHI